MTSATVATEPVRAAIYARISSDDDHKVKELGVKRQEDACRALVAARGWDLAGVYVDNNRSASKAKTERPEFDRLLADLAAGRVDRVVVLAQDRLVRKPDELELTMRLLRSRGIDGIDTVTDGHVNIGTTTGRTMARVKGVFDIAYAEYIGDKVREKKAELAARGLPAGGGTRPYGFQSDRVTVNKDEAKLIREAARRLLKGEALYSICTDWNERGVPTVTGRPWLPNVLRGTLTAPRVAGLRAHRGDVVGEAVWPAILDRATWEQVRILAAVPTYATTPSRKRKGLAPRLLTGLLMCGRCGKPMYAGTNNGKRAYACRKAHGFDGCGTVAVVAEPVEEIVVEEVLAVADTPDLGRTVTEAAGKSTPDMAGLEGRLVELAQMWAAGEISRPAYMAAQKVIDDQLAEARGRMGELAAVSAVSPYMDKPGLLRRRWGKLTDDQRRTILAAVIDNITIAPVLVRGRHSFDPDRVHTTWKV
jgi:DNA invertase Pin-like site-specific DNA recombinase